MTGKLSKEEAAELMRRHNDVLSRLRAVLNAIDDAAMLVQVEQLGREQRAFERRLAELTEG